MACAIYYQSIRLEMPIYANVRRRCQVTDAVFDNFPSVHLRGRASSTETVKIWEDIRVREDRLVS